MKTESTKKLHEKPKNVLEEKRKMIKQKKIAKNCKWSSKKTTNTLTKNAMNFVKKQLKTREGP